MTSQLDQRSKKCTSDDSASSKTGKKTKADTGRGQMCAHSLHTGPSSSGVILSTQLDINYLFFSLNKMNEVTQEQKKNHPSALLAAKSPLHSDSSCLKSLRR